MIRYQPRRWIWIVTRVRGTVLPRIAGRTAACMVIAAAAAHLRSAGIVDLSLPVVVHTIVGVALGLMLVFRTNASYDRYWEGRRELGGMVNTCRDLARQARSLLSHETARQRAGGYIIALYATIRRYLRGERKWPELEHILEPRELTVLDQRRGPPLTIATWLTEVFVSEADQGRLSDERLRMVEHNLTLLMDYWGGAERILRTPVPFAYAHHLKVFLVIFCFTVPFTLLQSLGWFSVVGAGIVAFGMFGIDEIGIEIEDPFGYDPNDLPLDEIGEMLEVDVTETVEGEPWAEDRDTPPSRGES